MCENSSDGVSRWEELNETILIASDVLSDLNIEYDVMFLNDKNGRPSSSAIQNCKSYQDVEKYFSKQHQLVKGR